MRFPAVNIGNPAFNIIIYLDYNKTFINHRSYVLISDRQSSARSKHFLTRFLHISTDTISLKQCINLNNSSSLHGAFDLIKFFQTENKFSIEIN
jgi:hypothetical protein